jgi:hypothetical protein
MNKGGSVDRKTLVIGVALAGILILAAQAGSWEYARTELVPGEKTIASENGRYVARAMWGEDPMPPTMVSFSLAGPDERILWSSQAFGENAGFIANDGRTVVGMKGSGVEGLPATLTFYGPKGEKGRQVTVKGPSGTAFSQDGSTFFVRSKDLGIGAFDRSGKKLWQVPGGRLFTSSSDGKKLVVEDQGSLFLYEQGTLIGKASLGEPFAVALSFSPEGDLLGAVASHRLFIFRTVDLKPVWNTGLKEAGRSFTSLSLSKGGFTAVGVDYDAGLNVPPEKRYPKGEIVLFDAHGKKLWTQEIALGGFAPHRPLVSFSPDGRTIRATGVKETFVYEQR